MTVVEVSRLPEKFQPPGREAETDLRVPAPLAELIREATEGLTGAERGALLSRLRDEKPESLFVEGRADATREEWRERLVRWLKEEANRFMAAAASL